MEKNSTQIHFNIPNEVLNIFYPNLKGVKGRNFFICKN